MSRNLTAVFKDLITITIRSRLTTVLLTGMALVCTVIVADAAMVDAYVSNQQMETFGGFRDGTYAALIAIVSIVMQFVQSIYRERVNERNSIERTKQAAIFADSLSENHAATVNTVERVEKALEIWSKERPCIMSYRAVMKRVHEASGDTDEKQPEPRHA